MRTKTVTEFTQKLKKTNNGATPNNRKEQDANTVYD